MPGKLGVLIFRSHAAIARAWSLAQLLHTINSHPPEENYYGETISVDRSLALTVSRRRRCESRVFRPQFADPSSISHRYQQIPCCSVWGVCVLAAIGARVDWLDCELIGCCLGRSWRWNGTEGRSKEKRPRKTKTKHWILYSVLGQTVRVHSSHTG